MTTTIPPFNWPVPSDTDLLANGAAAMRALATAISATVDAGGGGGGGMDGQMIQRGSVTAGPSNAANFSHAVAFPRPFGTGTVVVMVNLASGAGGTAQWSARALSAGVNGFTLFGFGPTVATFSSPWTWLAVGNSVAALPEAPEE